MTRKRKHIPIEQKLAAVIAVSGLLAEEHVYTMRDQQAPASEVIKWIDWDHAALHSFGGSDRWWNLWPMLFKGHVIKSVQDKKITDKAKRIDKGIGATVRALRAGKKPPRRKSKWKRPF